MAKVEKYTHNQVSYKLRHNTREDPHPSSNTEIDLERTHLNYHLDKVGVTAKEAMAYYNKRIKEVYLYKRADVNTLCQWIFTAPKDLAPGQEEKFFRETFNFANSLYGEKNCVQAIVHRDEGVKDKDGNIIEGQWHMHYSFIPVVKNPKFNLIEQNNYFTRLSNHLEMKRIARKAHKAFNRKEPIRKSCTYEEKICADKLTRKPVLDAFHPKYQQWLNNHGVKATVHSGITGGKNRDVSQLKTDTKYKLLIKDLTTEIDRQNDRISKLIAELEQQKSLNRELSAKLDRDIFKNRESDVWGDQRSSWDRDITVEEIRR